MAKFLPGRSGNPAGRPRKPRTGPDKMRADLLREAPEILAKLVELAKGGDVAAAREVLGRCLPGLRPTDRPSPIEIGEGLTKAGKAILAGLEAGSLTPNEASSLAATVGTLAKTNELLTIEERITAIEELLHERQAT